MAIRLSSAPNPVLHNNRAAAFAGMAYWGRSLEDAGGRGEMLVCLHAQTWWCV